MAQSSIISDMKSETVKQLLNCDLFVDALEAQNISEKSDLVGTHIFTYPLNPEYLKEAITFVTVTVKIPKEYNQNSLYVCPVLQIYIISHADHMKISPKVIKTSANRNDFISQILDHLLNSKETSNSKFGLFGQLKLTRNEEGVISKEWLYRYMEFETIDFNQSLCESNNKLFFERYGYSVPEIAGD